jgi:hypothetical protein
MQKKGKQLYSLLSLLSLLSPLCHALYIIWVSWQLSARNTVVIPANINTNMIAFINL